MDYSGATKEQLYQISTDSTVGMSERYAAARELQGRSKEMRKYYDREQIIFTITLKTTYAEEYLREMDDEDLLELYDRVMG